MNNKGADQTVQISRLICTFVDHYSKTCLKLPLKKKTKKMLFKTDYGLMKAKSIENAPRRACQKYCRMLKGELSAILLTFIKLPFVIVFFKWSLKTGFITVQQNQVFL